MTPPSAPEVWTGFLLGTAGYGYTLMPMIDAPEYGPCRPLAWQEWDNSTDATRAVLADDGDSKLVVGRPTED